MSELFSEIPWENFADESDVVIGSYTVSQGRRLYRHKHPIPEYYYILRGNGYIFLNGEGVFLCPGMFLTISENVYHSVLNPFSKDLEILYVFPKGYFRDIPYITDKYVD